MLQVNARAAERGCRCAPCALRHLEIQSDNTEKCDADVVATVAAVVL